MKIRRTNPVETQVLLYSVKNLLSCVATKDGKAALISHILVFFLVSHTCFFTFHGSIQTMKFYFNDDELCKDSAYFGFVEPLQVSDLTYYRVWRRLLSNL